MQYRNPASTEHKIVEGDCCCGGPCPEECGCCEAYDGPDLDEIFAVGLEFHGIECLIPLLPIPRMERAEEGGCLWTVWFRAVGEDSLAPAGGWPDPGDWLASDATNGALPDGCISDGYVQVSVSIYCHNDTEDGNARWYFSAGMFGEKDFTPIEYDYCGQLGRGQCPSEGEFTYNRTEIGVACENDPEVWGADREGTITGVDCNPLP